MEWSKFVKFKIILFLMDIIDFFETLYQIVLIITSCIAFVLGAGRGRHFWCSKQAKKTKASTLLPPLEEAKRVSCNISSFLTDALNRNGSKLDEVCYRSGLNKVTIESLLNGDSKPFHRLVQLALALGLEFVLNHDSTDDIEDKNAYSSSPGLLTDVEQKKLEISDTLIELDNFRVL